MADQPENERPAAEIEDPATQAWLRGGPSSAEIQSYVEQLDREENAREEIAGFGMLAVGLFIPCTFIVILLGVLGLPARYWILVFALPVLASRLFPYWIMHRSRLAVPWLSGVRLAGFDKTKALIIVAIITVAGVLAHVLRGLL